MLKLNKNNKGFTIIEVMIVLAIAGLILLIVFLAVPALQRSSRNTQRKNDVGTLLSGLNTSITNNNGTIPASCDANTAACWANNSQGVKLGFYDVSTAGNVVWTKQASATAAPNVATDATGVVKLYNNAKCLDASTTTTQGTATSTATGASSRSIVAMYAIEGGGGTTYVCQEG